MAASGYRLIIGILAIIMASFLWIPLDWGMDLLTTALNSGISDADAITRNNIVNNAYYFTLIIIIIAVIIFIVKPSSRDDAEVGEVTYVQAPGF